MIRVPGFTPSRSGFKFTNYFDHLPLIDLHFTIAGKKISIPIGDAANGLCGGMAFAARDLHEAGFLPPEEAKAPAGGPLFDTLVSRLFHSFSLPFGPEKYLILMNPLLPDGETWFSNAGLAPHGRNWLMVQEEWPRIKEDLEAGVLVPLGLVQIKSYNPRDLGVNHQVLAYGYDLEGGIAKIYVYDPNHPGDDDVYIRLDLTENASPVASYSKPQTGRATGLHAFFRTPYSFSYPDYVDTDGAAMHLAGVTRAGRFWHSVRAANGAWSKFAQPGEQGEGDVISVDGAMEDGNLHLCAVTQDGQLWHSTNPPHEWEMLHDAESQMEGAGKIIHASITAYEGKPMIVVITDTGGFFMTKQQENGEWSRYEDPRFYSSDPGFILNADAADVEGDLHICVVTQDGRIWHAVRAALGGWTAFVDMTRRAGNRGPMTEVTCAGAGGMLHVCAVTVDGHLYHSIFRNGSWTRWGDIERQAGERGDFYHISAAASGSCLHLAATTRDGRLWHTIRQPDGKWQAFGDVERQAGEGGQFLYVSLVGCAGESAANPA